MKTVAEIIAWAEERLADARASLREETNHNSNHLATAYAAEAAAYGDLLEFIREH